MKPKNAFLPLLAASVVLTFSQAHAADGTWLGNNGNWSAPGTWAGSIEASGTGFTANFTGVNITANRTVTLDAARTIGNITFTDTTPSHFLTIGGTAVLTLDNGGNAPVITVTDAGTANRLEINAQLAGTGGLTKNGAGILRLANASSSYTGATVINAGLLDFVGVTNANLGGGAAAGRNITVAAGASIRFGALSNAFLNRIVETNAEIGVLTGSSSQNLDFSSGTGANLSNAFLGAWVSNNAKTEYGGVLTAASDFYRLGSPTISAGVLAMLNSSTMGGTQGLIVGGGSVELVGAKTFSGNTTIRDGARLGLADFTGGTGNALGLQNSVLNLGAPASTGTFWLEGISGTGPITGAIMTTSATFGGLQGSRNLSAAYTGTIIPGSGNVVGTAVTAITGFTLNTGTGVNVTYDGAIGGFGTGASAGAGGNMTLTKTGAGTQILGGTSSYTGATNVNDGTLIINGSISTSILTTVASGATIGGSGTTGALTIQSGGFIAPGNSPGILNVEGNYIQAGTYTAEINGLTAGTQHDQINVTGTVDITGGSLATLFSTFTPVANNLIFILLNDGADAITGTFTGLAQGAVVATYGGFDWIISYTANSGSSSFTGGNDIALMATVIPEPSAALLGGLGLLALLRRRR